MVTEGNIKMKNKQIILDSIRLVKDILTMMAKTGDSSLMLTILSEVQAIESLVKMEEGF